MNYSLNYFKITRGTYKKNKVGSFVSYFTGILGRKSKYLNVKKFKNKRLKETVRKFLCKLG